MADAIVWADKLPDIIRKWILVIPMILAVGGSSTGLYQYFDKQDAIDKKNKDIHEVATAFQKIITELEPEQKPTKKIIIQKNCNECMNEIEKLKRWH